MGDFSFAPLTSLRHAPLVRWLWTGASDEETVRAQLRALREMGCGGVIFSRRDGREPHADSAWAGPLHAAWDQCRDLQLRAWLGHSAHSVSAPDDEQPADLLAHAIEFHVQDVAMNRAAQWQPPALDGELLCAVAVPLADLNRTPDWTRAVPLPAVDAATRALLLSGLDADARVYLWTQVRDGTRSALDPMHPDTGRLLVESVGAWLRAARGGRGWDANMTGLHLSAPELWRAGQSDGERAAATRRFPWSLHLPRAFADEHGYDLIERLPSLIADTGPDAARVRQDFWTTVVRLLDRNFWEPLHGWATSHGLSCAGAVTRHAALHRIVAALGDAAPGLRALAPPGIASSCLRGGGLHARLCASVAALEGRAGALAETEQCGWDATPQQQLPALHHLLQQGITAFVAAAVRPSLDDDGNNKTAAEAKGESSDEFDTASLLQQPYSERFRDFAGYIARCCDALSRGRSGARVGLLWPARSAWAHHHPKGHRFVRWVEEDLEATASLLDELHYSFLLLPEETLCAARCEAGCRVSGIGPSGIGSRVEDGRAPDPKLDAPGPEPESAARLLCGAAQMPLQMIVLPSVTALSWVAWRKLEEFIAAGGRVVCLGLLPRWSERGRDEALENHIGQTTRLTVADAYEAYAMAEHAEHREGETEDAPPASEFVGYPIAREYQSGGRLCCYQPRLNFDAEDARLRAGQLLKESLPPDLETQSPDILHARRVCRANVTQTDVEQADVEQANGAWAGGKTAESGELFFVFNASEAAQRVHLRLYSSCEGLRCAPRLLDAWTGESHALPVWMPFSHEEGGGLGLSLEMAAHEARLLWLGHAKHAPPHAEHADFSVETVVVEAAASGGDGAKALKAIDDAPTDNLRVRGYATQAGVPAVAVRQKEKAVWLFGPAVEVPAPLLLPDEWSARRIGPNVLVLDDWLMPQSGGWRTGFRVESLPQSLFLAFGSRGAPSGIDRNEVFLNEQRLVSCETPFPDHALWRDAMWRWFTLDAARPGLNALAVRVARAAPLSGRFAGCVVGDFSLREDFGDLWGSAGEDKSDEDGPDENTNGAPPAITKTEPLALGTGSWHEQGLPFYAGSVELAQRIEAPRDWEHCRVFLEVSRARDAVEVWLNGVCAGGRVAAPYRFDVTAGLRAGDANEVTLKLWNSAQAVLEGHRTAPAPSGVLGPVRLVAYPIVEVEGLC